MAQQGGSYVRGSVWPTEGPWVGLGDPGGMDRILQPGPAQKDSESLSDFACVPHELVCMSGYTCPCLRVCVHLHVSLSSVCITCPYVFVKRHTSGCACISLHIPGPVCIHFSPCAPRINVCVSLCIQVCLSTHGFVQPHMCVVVLVHVCGHSTYIGVGKLFLERPREQIILALRATRSLSQLLSLTIVVKKQPQTMSK